MPRVQKHVRKKRSNNNSIKNITSWKQSILEQIINDDELAKLLIYHTPDALSLPEPTREQRESLVNSCVMGYRFIPETAEDAKSWISLSTSRFAPQEGFRQFSDDYLMGFIFFYILVDTAVMETETGYRQDLIAERIHYIFQESRDFGMGELRLESFVENWEHNNKFGGYTMGFRTVDFK